MQVSSFYPVIGATQVATTADFYVRHFDFDVTFQADWYVSLKRKNDYPFELAILDFTHDTVPEAFRKPVQGILLNFEVADVDSEYERLIKKAGLPLVKDIKSETFGQRHFITVDPEGVLIDVIMVIEPSEEFASQYTGQS